MSYYWFNRQELLQKAKEKYDNGGKEKAAKYYRGNKYVIKEKANSKYKNLTEEEKEAKRQYFDNGGKNMSLKIEDESVYLKYTEIWNKIKKSLGIKFHS